MSFNVYKRYLDGRSEQVGACTTHEGAMACARLAIREEHDAAEIVVTGAYPILTISPGYHGTVTL